MNISFYTVASNLDTTRGYGAAGFKVVTSLQALGHTVKFDDPDSPVQISFCQPAWYKHYPDQYKIGYTPWESTELPDGWRDYMNACDEVWATSKWVKDVYLNNGVVKPVHVFEHGIDPSWKPVERTPGDVVKFLHIGEPALRKGGQMAVDAFRAAFGDRTDVHLTVKCYYQHWLRAWKDGEHVTIEAAKYNNVTLNTDLLDPPQLRKLYADHDVLVYPSYGEGFGLIPLQALGTGMPVISTYDWAPYEKFIQMGVPSRLMRSIWSVHPGDVFYPDYQSLIYYLRYAKDNIERLHKSHYEQASQVHQEFDWLAKTEKAVAHLLEKF